MCMRSPKIKENYYDISKITFIKGNEIIAFRNTISIYTQ